MGKLYFSKYQFFSENPNEKVQAKSKCNVKANKFREIVFLFSLWQLGRPYRTLKLCSTSAGLTFSE